LNSKDYFTNQDLASALGLKAAASSMQAGDIAGVQAAPGFPGG